MFEYIRGQLQEDVEMDHMSIMEIVALFAGKKVGKNRAAFSSGPDRL